MYDRFENRSENEVSHGGAETLRRSDGKEENWDMEIARWDTCQETLIISFAVDLIVNFVVLG